MSKALEALQEICGYYYQSPQYKIIENALKEYELMKNIRFVVADKKISDDDIDKLKNQRVLCVGAEETKVELLFDEKTQKKLKALDIVKELLNLKVVELLPNNSDTRLFVNCGNFKASVMIPPTYIDLLKEIFDE